MLFVLHKSNANNCLLQELQKKDVMIAKMISLVTQDFKTHTTTIGAV
jgi:hypothetical protein